MAILAVGLVQATRGQWMLLAQPQSTLELVSLCWLSKKSHLHIASAAAAKKNNGFSTVRGAKKPPKSLPLFGMLVVL